MAHAGETTVYIGLGSNMGNRAQQLSQAQESMEKAGIRILRRSSLYWTEPVDAPPQPWFLNAVIEAETALIPEQLLHALATIERQMGRERIVARGPRPIDLDILLYGSGVIRTTELQIPHPGIPHRRFVLAPLAELAPELRHPVLNKSIAELLAETEDRGKVRLWSAAAE